MKFKPGQEITPNKKEFKLVDGSGIPAEHMPIFGQVYTVAFYPFEEPHPKHKYLMLEEIPYALYNEDSFDPLLTSKELIEGLWSQEDIKHDRHLIDG